MGNVHFWRNGLESRIRQKIFSKQKKWKLQFNYNRCRMIYCKKSKRENKLQKIAKTKDWTNTFLLRSVCTFLALLQKVTNFVWDKGFLICNKKLQLENIDCFFPFNHFTSLDFFTKHITWKSTKHSTSTDVSLQSKR